MPRPSAERLTKTYNRTPLGSSDPGSGTPIETSGGAGLLTMAGTEIPVVESTKRRRRYKGIKTRID
jgi:hypothetical protein